MLSKNLCPTLPPQGMYFCNAGFLSAVLVYTTSYLTQHPTCIGFFAPDAFSHLEYRRRGRGGNVFVDVAGNLPGHMYLSGITFVVKEWLYLGFGSPL